MDQGEVILRAITPHQRIMDASAPNRKAALENNSEIGVQLNGAKAVCNE
jgi:hypothetical protein